MTYVNKKTIFLISLAVLAVTLSFVIAEQANAISVGNTVRFTANTNVRQYAGTNYPVNGTATAGSTARILSGPLFANGYTWWGVTTSSGISGYAIQNYMVVVSAPTPVPTVSVSASPTSITLGRSFTFSWSSTNATSCTGSRGGSYPTSGSISITPTSTGTYSAGMQCSGPGGTSSMQYAYVTVNAAAQPPTVSVSVNPTSISLGQSIIFSWSSTNASYCTGSRGGSYATSGSFSTTPPSLPYSYGMSCTGPGGTSPMQTATVSQKAVSPPVVSITSSVSSINVGQSATLGWGTSNATSCNGSASPSDSNWSGSITPVGGGSRTVSPVRTTTYTLNCSGPGGSVSNSVTITVNQPAGPVTCTAPGSSSISKAVNQNFTINWCMVNVSSWSVSGPGLSRNGGAVGNTPQPFSASYPSQFSVSLSPSPSPYVYSVTGTGPTGSVTRSMTVTITSVVSPQCSDGSDNDSDGKTDYPSDPGCSGAEDNDEADPPPVTPNAPPSVEIRAE